jgi:hypothetical protein
MAQSFTREATDKKSLKVIITEAVLEQIPAYPDRSTEKAIGNWWYTKNGDGLRLTPIGDTAFRMAEIEFFDLPLKVNQGTWYSFMVDAGKKIKCPYFISSDKKSSKIQGPFIRIYDSKIAMMIELYGGINNYMDSIKARR